MIFDNFPHRLALAFGKQSDNFPKGIACFWCTFSTIYDSFIFGNFFRFNDFWAYSKGVTLAFGAIFIIFMI